MKVRNVHRTLALFFSPFLVLSAVTGLLWAYAPYLYLKPEPPKEKTVVRASRIALYSEEGKEVYGASFSPKDQNVTVDEYGLSFKKKTYPAFYGWVMRIHRLGFFGTKKELVILPGFAALALAATGAFLLKKRG